MPVLPSTPKGRATRAQILAAGRVVFERHSYFDVRVADISAEAGLSHGSFYTYFASKDDVLHALIDDLVDHSYEASAVAVDRTASPLQQLQGTIAHFMHAYAERAELHRVLNQVVTLNDEFLAKRHKIRSRFVDRIDIAIRGWQARGDGDPTLDAAHAAQALGGMIEDFAYTLYVLKAPLDEDLAITTMARVWAKTVGVPAR